MTQLWAYMQLLIKPESFFTLPSPLSSPMVPSVIRLLHLSFSVTATNAGPHLLKLEISLVSSFIQVVDVGGGVMLHCMTRINSSNSH